MSREFARFLTGLCVLFTCLFIQRLLEGFVRVGRSYLPTDLTAKGGNFDLNNFNVSNASNDSLCVCTTTIAPQTCVLRDTANDNYVTINTEFDHGDHNETVCPYNSNNNSNNSSNDSNNVAYSREELLSMKAKHPISDELYHHITDLGIRKRPRGRKGGARVRKRISVAVSDARPDQPNTNELRPYRVLTQVPIINSNTSALKKGTQLPAILLTNATSLKNKMDEFETIVKDTNTDIAAVSESWYFDKLPDDCSLCNIPCFQCYRNDILHKRGGGVTLFVRDHIKSTMLSDITIPEDLEVLWIHVPCPSAAGSSIYICVVYHPPKDPRADVLFDHIVTY